MPNAALQPIVGRAMVALERGRAREAIDLLAPVLKAPATLSRADELELRILLAESYLLQGDLAQTAVTLGRSPDALRETLAPVLLSNLWRLHGQVALARGDQSRAIALLNRALKLGEAAHDSRAIGLAHLFLGRCYRQVGEVAIVSEHIVAAAAALHAAGDRRHLAMVHSLSAVAMAQTGRHEEADGALRQAERLASAVYADDLVATICGNQANVALIRHRYDQALTLAERAVVLQESIGVGPGLSVALATLGQIIVRQGNLDRAEQVLHRALEGRRATKFHETTGAVYDSLAQVSLVRGNLEQAADYLRQAAEAYGAYGRETGRWYEWNLRIVSGRLATRRGRPDEAVTIADEILASGDAPPAVAIEADLVAGEALLAASRAEDAERRLSHVESRLDPRAAPGTWGEFLRLRGALRARQRRTTEAYHDMAQSASVYELLGEQYQAALSQLALGELAASAGATSMAARHVRIAADGFRAVGAQRDLDRALAAAAAAPTIGTGDYVGSPADADDVVVRRLVNAAVFPQLLARELAAAVVEAVSADLAVVFVERPTDDPRLIAHSGIDAEGGQAIARLAASGAAYGAGSLVIEAIGHEPDGRRMLALASDQPLGHPQLRRLRMMAAVARQGFDLCGARDRPAALAAPATPALDPLLPGFVCASAAMNRVVEQIQRLQGNNLTVLITGESGTGKELIAQAIHAGSTRRAKMFLPFNCTTTTKELADSQLFGHRRGSFTGAMSDQPGLVRAAAGGTLFLDEVGDVPLDVQPKLLRFLEQGEIMPVGETRPLPVDVRILAATNADLEQRVADGAFREDLYYRLSVIRIHVPPLRERREEIPHLTTSFLREACERLGKHDMAIGARVLDLFAQYWWPGNVRQLKNEIQRGVAMAPDGGTIEPDHVSPDLSAPAPNSSPVTLKPALQAGQSLAELVSEVERDLIRSTLSRLRGNISESARVLGLTRRGLYLKLQRLGVDESVDVDTK